MEQASINTNKELYRDVEGDAYSPSLHVTIRGGIGINVGGRVITKSLEEWHELARKETDAQFTCNSCGHKFWRNPFSVSKENCINCGSNDLLHGHYYE